MTGRLPFLLPLTAALSCAARSATALRALELAQRREAVLAAYRKLPSLIPGIVSFEVGLDQGLLEGLVLVQLVAVLVAEAAAHALGGEVDAEAVGQGALREDGPRKGAKEGGEELDLETARAQQRGELRVEILGFRGVGWEGPGFERDELGATRAWLREVRSMRECYPTA